MYVKIHDPKYSDHAPNTGSCENLVEYLEKENLRLKSGEKTYFFSHSSDGVVPSKVIQDIDANHSKLKNKEAKFFMVTINPSEDELKHISDSKEKLMQYTRKVMEGYAKNFNRELDGKPLTADDLLYYAKIEKTRFYKPEEKLHSEAYINNYRTRKEQNALKQALIGAKGSPSLSRSLEAKIKQKEKKYIRDRHGVIILPGNKKKGTNTHVHVIVSRKDKSGRMSLSPFAKPRKGMVNLNGEKHKIGFDRHVFVKDCETIFDRNFGYVRNMGNSYEYRHARVHDTVKYYHLLKSLPTTPEQVARYLLRKAIKQSREVRSIVNMYPSSISKVLNKSVGAVADLVGANPAGIGVKAIKIVLDKGLKIALSSGIKFT